MSQYMIQASASASASASTPIKPLYRRVGQAAWHGASTAWQGAKAVGKYVSKSISESREEEKRYDRIRGRPVMIGEGKYGCVYSSHPPCLDEAYYPEDYAYKLMSRADALKQLQENNNIDFDAVDPQSTFTVGKPKLCKKIQRDILPACHALKYNMDDPAVLIFKNGGYTLDEYIWNFRTTSFFVVILKLLSPLIKGVATLNKRKHFHLDIKMSNIVTNTLFDGPFRLVDFGSATTWPARSVSFPSKPVMHYPIDVVLINGIKEEQYQQYIEAALSQDEYLQWFYSQNKSQYDISLIAKKLIASKKYQGDQLKFNVLSKIDVFSLARLIFYILEFFSRLPDAEDIAALGIKMLYTTKALHYDNTVRCDIHTLSDNYDKFIATL